MFLIPLSQIRTELCVEMILVGLLVIGIVHNYDASRKKKTRKKEAKIFIVVSLRVELRLIFFMFYFIFYIFSHLFYSEQLLDVFAEN